MLLITYVKRRTARSAVRRQTVASSPADAQGIVRDLRKQDGVSQVQVWKPAQL